MQKKVSLISPCYNGEKYLCWFLDSLLAQTYQNVEFIFVNDGSTDKSEEIFLSYKPKLEEKGWQVIYISKQNGGVASAVNEGLKIFSGEYLICPDSDDILYPDHIEKKVAFMEKNPSAGVAFNAVDVVNEGDIDTVIGKRDNQKRALKNYKDNMLLFKVDIWTPIAWIMKSECFFKEVPSREIYLSRTGQNFQILYPVVRKYPTVFMSESMGKYVVRQGSISHVKTDKEKDRQHQYELYTIALNTISKLECKIEEKTVEMMQTLSHFMPCFLRENGASKFSVTKKIMLFGVIPLVKIKKKQDKAIISLLGLPLFWIKD